MKTATINVKTEPALKRRAQAFAQNAGMSLSDIVNLSLRQVVNLGEIVVHEHPSEYLREAIKEARQERQKCLYKFFKSGQDAVSFVKNLK